MTLSSLRLHNGARQGHKGSGLAGTVGIWFTTWDASLHANEFFEALEHALPQFSGDTGTTRGNVMRFKSANGQIVAERRGSEVLLILGASAGATDAIRTDVWKNWKRTSP